MSGDALQIATTPRERHAAALRMLFSHLSVSERTATVSHLLADSGVGSPTGLLEARRGERLEGVVWAQTYPGASALIWPPAMDDIHDDVAAMALLAAVDDFLAEEGVVTAQVLLESRSVHQAVWFEAAGFVHMVDLHYMACLEHHFPTSPPAQHLDFEPYSEQNHARLARIVLQTHEESLDCPRLNGVRDVEDVLSGYRATGRFDPGHWLIVRADGNDVGCLLLADHPGPNNLELVYMGLAPGGRGHSRGLAMARHAQWLARERGRPRVVLAVDVANGPALATYEAAGFVGCEKRSVLMRILASEANSP